MCQQKVSRLRAGLFEPRARKTRAFSRNCHPERSETERVFPTAKRRDVGIAPYGGAVCVRAEARFAGQALSAPVCALGHLPHRGRQAGPGKTPQRPRADVSS